jgi:hypothetical protein
MIESGTIRVVTDTQLYLSIGIPTFAVLVSILTNVIHHNAVNARFNSVDGRFSGQESRFNSIESRFNSIEATFNNLDLKFDTLIGKAIDLDNRVTRIEAKLGIS